MRRRQIAAVFFLFLLPSLAVADPRAYFDRLIRGDDLVTMNFHQTTFDDSGMVLEETDGVLQYLRPSFFRMEYESPQQPLLVSDGELLWYYEADLKQVVVSPLQEMERNGLLTLFSSGGLEALLEHYVVTSGVGSNGLVWLNAEPQDAADSLRRIQLGFDNDGVLRQIKVLDAFGGAIQMDISSVGSRVADADFFAFTPPPDTEIIRTGE